MVYILIIVMYFKLKPQNIELELVINRSSNNRAFKYPIGRQLTYTLSLEESITRFI